MNNKISVIKVLSLIGGVLISTFTIAAPKMKHETISRGTVYENINWKYEDEEIIEELKMLASTKNSDVRVKDIRAFKEMKEFIKVRNSKVDDEHFKKRYKDIDGEDIDCVDVYYQPSLKTKGMKDHEIQFQPPFVVESDGSEFDLYIYYDNEQRVIKLTLPTVSNSQCDKGTIPLKKLKIKHLARFSTLKDFKNKKAGGVPEKTETVPALTGPTNTHQYAVIKKSVNNWGISSKIAAFNPYTEKSSEFSLSQIWVSRGSGSNLETVEAGLQRYNQRSGDSNARIFIYFTPDNYGSGGCYDLECSGFVQVDHSIAIGSRLSVYSQIGGSQYEMQMALIREQTVGNWWLQINGKWIGYWPNSLFDSNGIKDQGSTVDAGGEIVQDNSTRHTTTDMGSGRFASEGWSKAAFQREIMYVNTNNQYVHMTSPIIITTDSNCYDINFTASSGSWKSYFYMGGAGYNTNCQ